MKIIEFIYRCALSTFEFMVDSLIIFILIVILKTLFNEGIIINGVTLLIVFCGLVYSIRDAIEVFNENKFKK